MLEQWLPPEELTGRVLTVRRLPLHNVCPTDVTISPSLIVTAMACVVDMAMVIIL